MATEDERTTTGIIMIEITPRIRTREDMAEGTRNDERTWTRIGSTRNDMDTTTTDAIRITEGEIFADTNTVGPQPEQRRPKEINRINFSIQLGNFKRGE